MINCIIDALKLDLFKYLRIFLSANSVGISFKNHYYKEGMIFNFNVNMYFRVINR